jgi:hypothetical protein
LTLNVFLDHLRGELLSAAQHGAAGIPAQPRSTEMEDRQRLIAQNEAIWRAINELDPPDPGRSEDIYCECGRTECPARVRVDHSTYERVRGFPEQFFVVPGHELPEAETVVERRQEFLIVEKQGLAAIVAEETDPRS